MPQLVPLLFIHSVTGALIAAAPIGLMGGVATAAYLDLMIRSCPRGLQGTMLMLSAGALCDRRAASATCWARTSTTLRRLHRLRDRDHRGLRPDPAGAAAGAETADRHRGRADAGGRLHSRLGRGRRRRTRAWDPVLDRARSRQGPLGVEKQPSSRYSSVKNGCAGILSDLTKRIVGVLVAPSQFAGQPDQKFGVGQ